MQSETQPEATARSSTAHLAARKKSSPNEAWRDFAWPCLLIPALLGGIVLSVETSGTTYAKALAKVQNTLYWRPSLAAAANEQFVLVVVANPDREMQVMATLSPRGFKPRRAKDIDQVTQMFAATTPALVVLDSSAPDAGAISRFLRARLPKERIVVLNRSMPREAIGQILLDRLMVTRTSLSG
jgi:hypothetical protein